MLYDSLYIVVGGGIAAFFYTAVAKKFNETSEITAFCDINRTRLEYRTTEHVYVNDAGDPDKEGAITGMPVVVADLVKF